MQILFNQPSEYAAGAWQVSIQLEQKEYLQYEVLPIPFLIPKLENRLILSDSGFHIVVPHENSFLRKGVFINGMWRGHVYTNGIAEDKNPTSIVMVRESLRSEVEAVFKIIKADK